MKRDTNKHKRIFRSNEEHIRLPFVCHFFVCLLSSELLVRTDNDPCMRRAFFFYCAHRCTMNPFHSRWNCKLYFDGQKCSSWCTRWTDATFCNCQRVVFWSELPWIYLDSCGLYLVSTQKYLNLPKYRKISLQQPTLAQWITWTRN